MRLAQLEIPSSPEFVSLVRLVVSSVADDRYDLTDEQLDNLKLAVSEACVMAMGPRSESNAESSTTLSVACEGSFNRLDVSVEATSMTGNAATFDGGDDLLGNGLGLPFIESLVDTVSVGEAGGGQRLTLSLNCLQAEQL